MEGEAPKISVVVPVYNVENYIRNCLDAIAAQTYPNLEIIAVDDASTDKSGKICEAYALQEPRLRVVHFSRNRGPSAARNEGIRLADGQFVSFVDADDLVEANLLEKLYDSLLEHQADISVCGADGIKLAGGSAAVYSGREAVCCMAKGVPFNHVPWGKLYRTELVKKCPFDEQIFYSEDLLFLYQVLQLAKRVSYLPDKLYHYTCREGSQVHGKISKRKCTTLFVQERISRDAAKTIPEAVTDFQQFALDVDTRLAMQAVEDGTEESLFSYLKAFQKDIRCQFSWKAVMRCPEKKSRAAILLLYISTFAFWGTAVIYREWKRVAKKGRRKDER